MNYVIFESAFIPVVRTTASMHVPVS